MRANGAHPFLRQRWRTHTRTRAHTRTHTQVAKGIKDTEDIIYKHKEFQKWCMRKYKHPTDDTKV